MVAAAQYYMLFYGVMVLVGGIMGFVKAKSKASLIAGVISGIAIIGCYFFSRQNPGGGMIASMLVGAVLTGMMGPRFMRTKKFMPSGLVAILSIINLLLAFSAVQADHLIGSK